MSATPAAMARMRDVLEARSTENVTAPLEIARVLLKRLAPVVGFEPPRR